MIFARRHATEDDLGDVMTDYEGVEVPRAAKRALPFDDATLDGHRRMVKLLAIKILRENGMKPDDVAIAVGHSRRHVFRRSSLMRAVAEAAGRV